MLLNSESWSCRRLWKMDNSHWGIYCFSLFAHIHERAKQFYNKEWFRSESNFCRFWAYRAFEVCLSEVCVLFCICSLKKICKRTQCVSMGYPSFGSGISAQNTQEDEHMRWMRKIVLLLKEMSTRALEIVRAWFCIKQGRFCLPLLYSNCRWRADSAPRCKWRSFLTPLSSDGIDETRKSNRDQCGRCVEGPLYI